MISRVPALLAGLLAAVPSSNAQQVRLPSFPVYFEPNRGQADPSVRFLGRSQSMTLLIRDAGIVFLAGSSSIRMHFPNSPSVARFQPRQRLSSVSNYYPSVNPDSWRIAVPHYASLAAEGLLPGVDLVLYSAEGEIEYDLIVSAGIDPSLLELRFDGAARTSIDGHGNLLLHTSSGLLRHKRPNVYQDGANGRSAVPSSYRLMGSGRVGFQFGRFDRSRAIRIDPVLSYASYLGGTAIDNAFGVATDAQGNFFVCGQTASANFPLTNAADSAFSESEAFLAKFTSSGALAYSTFFGGSGVDFANDVAVDAQGNAYITGLTRSPNLPALSALFPNFGGGVSDAFVAKFGPQGMLLYSSYLGGSEDDSGTSVAVDAAGNVSVAGSTRSANFPVTAGAFDPTHNGETDVFVAKLNPQGNALSYSTYLGGAEGEGSVEIAVDGAGHLYASGFTESTDFPVTPGAAQPALSGLSDGFIVKLNVAGSGLVFSTFLGGTEDDVINDIAIDSLNRVHVTGSTFSGDFPTTPGAFDETHNGANDVFVTRLNSLGTAILYSTLLGGSGPDSGDGIRIHPSGNVIVSGMSLSIPVTGDAIRASPSGTQEVFLAVFSLSGSGLVFATYLGGRSFDQPLALDAAGNVYLASSASPVEPASVTSTAIRPVPESDDAYVAVLTGFPLPDCRGGLTATATAFPAAGGNGVLNITPLSACDWAATRGLPFLTLSGTSGAGAGAPQFQAGSNAATGPRFAAFAALQRLVHVAQAGTLAGSGFADVPSGDPFVHHIAMMRLRGITSGCSQTEYCPNSSTTRGQMAVFIIRGLIGENFPFPVEPFFIDVPSSHPFFRYIQKMRELGITSGCSSNEYCPDATVTRGQMAVFIIRSLFGNRIPTPAAPAFVDVSPAHPFFAFIERLREMGITTGCSAVEYCPDSPVTRGQMAVFLIRAFLSAW